MSSERKFAGGFRIYAGWLAVVLALLAVSGCISLGSITPSRLREEVVQSSEKVFDWNKIAIIDIDGAIGIRRGLLGLSGTSVSDVKQKLQYAEEDSRVRGVLLRVNSPGGEVVSCDLIYHEIMEFRQRTGKPVVAYMVNMGASGGYYVSLASDHISSHPAAITGSIGVIMNFVNIEMLTQLLGIENIPIASGEKKDMGSSTRQMTEEEMDMFAEMNKLLFDRFLGLVALRRGISEENLDIVADGRLLLASQAEELGLLDSVGLMDDALDEVKRRAGIRTAHVVAYTPFQHYNRNIYASFQAERSQTDFMKQLMQALTIEAEPQMLYMWAPGR